MLAGRHTNIHAHRNTLPSYQGRSNVVNCENRELLVECINEPANARVIRERSVLVSVTYGGAVVCSLGVDQLFVVRCGAPAARQRPVGRPPSAFIDRCQIVAARCPRASAEGSRRAMKKAADDEETAGPGSRKRERESELTDCCTGDVVGH